MSRLHDCLVVGSGISAAQAAQTLLEGGRRVTIVDVGHDDEHYRALVPDTDFVAAREEDEEQHRYLLGDDFEGVPWGPARHTMTPPRQYITAEVDEWLRVRSETFSAMESLGYGGLGSGWGAGCGAYPDAELEAMGLDVPSIRAAYRVAAQRIGLAAEVDDLSPYCLSGLDASDYLPPMELDEGMAAFHRAYQRRRTRLRSRGVPLARPPLAVLTEDRDQRRATRYQDMEFWTDAGNAVYRPRVTVDRLREHEGCDYRPGLFVTRFSEEGEHVVVEAVPTAGGDPVRLEARTLVLATGTLGSARLALRSLGGEGRHLPILTNPYALAPCLHLRRLGKGMQRNKTSMAQLALFHDPGFGNHGSPIGARMLSIYTYRSLMLFKLAKEAPLDLRSASRLMQRLAPALLIVSLNHPDTPSEAKYLTLERDEGSPTGDRLMIEHRCSDEEEREHRASEKVIFRSLRQLGAYPLRRQQLEAGASVHYAGCLPISSEAKDWHLAPDGRLHGTRAVYVVDGSGFRYLPSNGLTFTIMAWAHQTALGLTGSR
ncbi:MAG: hypothetical protein O2816_16420 [Planctomycetota bacterium]|nr:hypothetical protein [Planctomycetota bacterium]